MLNPRDANILYKRYSKVFIAGYERERDTFQIHINADGVRFHSLRVFKECVNSFWSGQPARIR